MTSEIAVLTKAYVDVYSRLEETQLIRYSYRTALANCYIGLSALLSSKTHALAPEVRTIISDIVSETETVLGKREPAA